MHFSKQPLDFRCSKLLHCCTGPENARLVWANYTQPVSQIVFPRIVSILPSCLRFVLPSSLHQEFQPWCCLNLNHPLELQVSLPYYLVRLSLWEPNCLPLLLRNTALTKQGDVPVTGAALNSCSVGYMFRSGSKTGYLSWKFFIALISVLLQTRRQNTSHSSLSQPPQLRRHELYHWTLSIHT